MTYHYELTIIDRPVLESLLSDLNEAADLCGLHPEMIEEYLRAHLVSAVRGESGKVYFDQSGISRLRHIAYLRDHEGTSLKTLRYIMSLLDHLEAKEHELQELRERAR